MSYRKLSIHDVSDIIGRWRAEQSARRIARETGLDRKTVRRYLAAAASSSLPRDREPRSEELLRITQIVQTRPRPQRSDTWNQLLSYKDRIAAAVSGDRPLRLRGIHRTLQGEGVNVTYWMLRRFALEMIEEQTRAQLLPPPSERAARGPASSRRGASLAMAIAQANAKAMAPS